MWVKICGLTNLQDAQAAVEAGADALGFIFVRSSPRYLPQHSPDWGEWLGGFSERFLAALGMTGSSDSSISCHSERGEESPRLVSVITKPDELPSNWQIFDALQWVIPDGVSPTADALRWLPDLPLWAALRFPPEVSAQDALATLEQWSPYVEQFVLDTYHPQQLGGTGATHDWERAAALCAHAPKPVILAGGLTPENVADAVRQVRPAGVDVSSGVEAQPGRKDLQKVQAFLQHAKRAWGGEVG